MGLVGTISSIIKKNSLLFSIFFPILKERRKKYVCIKKMNEKKREREKEKKERKKENAEERQRTKKIKLPRNNVRLPLSTTSNQHKYATVYHAALQHNSAAVFPDDFLKNTYKHCRKNPQTEKIPYFFRHGYQIKGFCKYYKRKNLEFQMLAAVYHKGDHGQYCYTLK